MRKLWLVHYSSRWLRVTFYCRERGEITEGMTSQVHYIIKAVYFDIVIYMTINNIPMYCNSYLISANWMNEREEVHF